GLDRRRRGADARRGTGSADPSHAPRGPVVGHHKTGRGGGRADERGGARERDLTPDRVAVSVVWRADLRASLPVLRRCWNRVDNAAQTALAAGRRWYPRLSG